MGFKTLMFSPQSNVGLTTVSALIAHTFAYNGFTSMLGYTDTSNAIPQFFGVTDLDDPTRSITQVMRMVDSNAIQPKDVLKYAFQYDPKVKAYFMNFGDERLNTIAQQRIIEYIHKYVPTDITIWDMSSTPDDPFAQTLMQDATSIFLVTDVSDKGITMVKNWLESDVFPDVNNVYIVINKYSSEIMPWKRLADKYDILPSHLCKLHYNPYINKCALEHCLQTITPTIQNRDPRVAILNNDIKEIVQAVNDYNIQKKNRINIQDEISKIRKRFKL